MKRIALLSLLLSAILWSNPTGATAQNNPYNQPEQSTVCGDANCDGSVNVLDLITMINHIMSMNPQPFCFANADLNADALVNVLDVIGAINIIMQVPGLYCPPCPPTVTDSDGNTYPTIKIGDQCWMKENIKTTKYRNGTAIEYPGTNNSAWQNNTTGAYAWINNDIARKDEYGALYNWYAVNNSNNLCPMGWHVAGDIEWSQLTDFITGGTTTGGNQLKSCRQVNSPIGGACATNIHPRWELNQSDYGTDTYGFSGLPGGTHNSIGQFLYLGYYGIWWSTTEYGTAEAWTRYIFHSLSIVYQSKDTKKSGYSVRCMKDL